MKRLTAALAVTVVAVVVGSAAPGAAAAPPISQTLWAIPAPFGAPPDQVNFSNQINRPKRSIDAPVGAGSLYQIRKLRWTKWGAKTVTAKGRARYCSDSCEPWRRVTIRLSQRVTKPCGEGRVRQYERYYVSGFEYLEARVYRSGQGPCV